MEGDIVCFCEETNLPQFLKTNYNNIADNPSTREKAEGAAMVYTKYGKKIYVPRTFNWKKKSKSYGIGCIYLKPTLKGDYCIDLVNESLSQILNSYTDHEIISVGDFNAQLNQMENNAFSSHKIYEDRIVLHNKINNRVNKLAEVMDNLAMFVIYGKVEGEGPGRYIYLSANGK